MLVENYQQLYHIFPSGQYFSIKGLLETALLHISQVLNELRTQSNTKEQVSTVLTHIF